MKDKNLILLLLLMIPLLLTGCFDAELAGIPKGYIKKYEFYDKDGWMDFTDYAKYIYEDENKVIEYVRYRKVSLNDIENIKEYFDDFKKRMESSDRLDEYDFDDSIINEGDYVRIISKEENYKIYYFDMETKTLYYIHSKI